MAKSFGRSLRLGDFFHRATKGQTLATKANNSNVSLRRIFDLSFSKMLKNPCVHTHMLSLFSVKIQEDNIFGVFLGGKEQRLFSLQYVFIFIAMTS